MPRQTEYDDRVRVLAKARLLAGLSPESLRFLAQRVLHKQLQPGDIVFSEDQTSHGLYIIESGIVKLYKIHKDGREQVLATQGAGGILSVLSLTDGEKHPCSAVALVQSTLLFISTQTLQVLCQRDSHCTRQLLSIVAARLRSALGMIEELSFASVRARLAAYLLRTAAAGLNHNRFMARLPVNQEIAAHIGTVRELVSRHLGQLQAKGIIRITGRTLRILDWNALAQEAAWLPGIVAAQNKSLKSEQLFRRKRESGHELTSAPAVVMNCERAAKHLVVS